MSSVSLGQIAFNILCVSLLLWPSVETGFLAWSGVGAKQKQY